MAAIPQSVVQPQQPQQRAPTKSIGHYILGRTIGEGTFGKVKLGRHILSGANVAVKVLQKDRIVEVADVERVAREVYILKLIRHPHIVQLFEIIETRGQLYLIMEYASGGELFDYIVANGCVSESEACRFFHQIVAGVEKIHEMHVVHRDLKPENLLLDEHKCVKIVDFGLSNLFRDGQRLSTACGSPCYAPPEMVAGHQYVPQMCDLWSCGVILFAMVCGYLPFEDQNTANLYKKILAAEYSLPHFISEAAKDLIAGLLTVDPAQRFTIPVVRQHPWYNQKSEASLSSPDVAGGCSTLDEDVIRELEAYGLAREYAVRCLELNKHNHITTTYWLLLERKKRFLEQLEMSGAEGNFAVNNALDATTTSVGNVDAQVASNVSEVTDAAKRAIAAAEACVSPGPTYRIEPQRASSPYQPQIYQRRHPGQAQHGQAHAAPFSSEHLSQRQHITPPHQRPQSVTHSPQPHRPGQTQLSPPPSPATVPAPAPHQTQPHQTQPQTQASVLTPPPTPQCQHAYPASARTRVGAAPARYTPRSETGSLTTPSTSLTVQSARRAVTTRPATSSPHPGARDPLGVGSRGSIRGGGSSRGSGHSVGAANIEAASLSTPGGSASGGNAGSGTTPRSTLPAWRVGGAQPTTVSTPVSCARSQAISAAFSNLEGSAQGHSLVGGSHGSTSPYRPAVSQQPVTPPTYAARGKSPNGSGASVGGPDAVSAVQGSPHTGSWRPATPQQMCSARNNVHSSVAGGNLTGSSGGDSAAIAAATAAAIAAAAGSCLSGSTSPGRATSATAQQQVSTSPQVTPRVCIAAQRTTITPRSHQSTTPRSVTPQGAAMYRQPHTPTPQAQLASTMQVANSPATTAAAASRQLMASRRRPQAATSVSVPAGASPYRTAAAPTSRLIWR